LEHIEPTTKVKLPRALRDALQIFQKESGEYEWGGGIDFEIIKGKPQVERVLSYFGERGAIPTRVFRKYSEDVEVVFHTHPGQDKVQPSQGDISSFFSSPQQVDLIIAGNEILVLEKTPKTKTPQWTELKEYAPVIYNPEKYMPLLKEKLKDWGVEAAIVPRESTVMLDLNVVRKISHFNIEKNLINASTPDEYIYHLLEIHSVPSVLWVPFWNLLYACINLYIALKEGKLKKINQEIKALQERFYAWYLAIEDFSRRALPDAEEIIKKPYSFAKEVFGYDPYSAMESFIQYKLLMEEPLKRIFPDPANYEFWDVIEAIIQLYIGQQARQRLLEAVEEGKDIPATALAETRGWIIERAEKLAINMSYFFSDLKQVVDFPVISKPGVEHIGGEETTLRKPKWMTNKDFQLLKDFEATGRVVSIYPRLKLVSLSGMEKPASVAIEEIKEFFQTQSEQEHIS